MWGRAELLRHPAWEVTEGPGVIPAPSVRVTWALAPTDDSLAITDHTGLAGRPLSAGTTPWHWTLPSLTDCHPRKPGLDYRTTWHSFSNV